MRLIHLVALILSFIGMVYSVPLVYLPAVAQKTYVQWFGVQAYRDVPATQPADVLPFDIDDICPPEGRPWRAARTIEGVTVAAAEDCRPDNPWDIVAAVKGTNNVSMATLHQTLFAADAVEKSDDRDGDGDPDLIEIRLEVMELNGHSPDMDAVVPEFAIAPGVTPGFWVFAPKTRGMTTVNFESNEANRLVRLPGPAIRVEQGDEIRITLENTHYLPHTIHFHGADHPFKNPDGEGNDGVPMFSETPVMPGEQKTYWLKPRQPGTTFYHCHVQPQSHILMGLQGLLVIEENRPDNWLQTFNIGGGRVRVPSKSVRETYDREFDLHYLEIDRELNNRIQSHSDPRIISRAIHRGYNVTQRKAEYYTLNGQSFPYTMRDSLVITEPDKRYKLRVLNGGGEGLALHIHGHKPILTHRDGVALNDDQKIQRDVFWLASAQRLDLEINTTNDGLHAYDAGAWLVHDHRENAVTTDGIGPGGGVSLLVYDNYLTEQGLPQTVHGSESLAPFFDPAYYRGEIPVFAGMHGHDLGDPESPAALDFVRGQWLFLLYTVVFVILVSITLPVWRRR